MPSRSQSQIEQARAEWNAQKELQNGWELVKSKSALKKEKRAIRNRRRKDGDKESKQQNQTFHYDQEFPKLGQASCLLL